MGVLTFDVSGQGDLPITLEEVQILALSLGYGKAGADPKKPLGTRVDLKSFFDQYGVKAFSTFKKKFCTEELRPIGPGGVPMSKPKDPMQKTESAAIVHVKPEDIPPVSKFEELAGSFKDLKWRIISRPGGATMKPTNYYRLQAAVNQVEKGDIDIEKPMWAAHGGLDFDGRESWDTWNNLKGMSSDDAKKEFCKIWAEVHADIKANLRVY
eukprot:CAMPEP_0114288542 /NCGR_PEP_ID=MMETSP0059-20121206/6873_1 /TAXON_ID=36894 /ORGANISM="Pyramimonas parkeae, Strain CCMP726" /LENGTH=210 /DNA_ID=CAMNT_0001409709 /DNA_START=40 /DNA_END=672 /DNA_ORIENTATION=-